MNSLISVSGVKMWGSLTLAHPLIIAVLIIILNWFVSQPLTSVAVSWYASITLPIRKRKLWHVARFIYHWAKIITQNFVTDISFTASCTKGVSNSSFLHFLTARFHSSLIPLLNVSYWTNSVHWVISQIINTDYSRNHHPIILYLLKCIYILGFSKLPPCKNWDCSILVVLLEDYLYSLHEKFNVSHTERS